MTRTKKPAAGWQHPGAAHLTDLEKRTAGAWLHLDPATVAGPPTGLLVGEMPGTATNSMMPLFPHPSNSAGARLQKLSKMSMGIFLGRFLRTNVFPEHRSDWPHSVAQERAAMIIEATPPGMRVVLLGERTGLAFGLRKWYVHVEVAGVHYVCIPHPSGRNLLYNEPLHRTGATAALQWAANEIALPMPRPPVNDAPETTEEP